MKAKHGLMMSLVALLVGCGGAAPAPETTAPMTAEPSLADDTAPALNRDTESFEVAGVHVIHKQTPGNATIAVQVFVDGGVALVDRAHAGLDQLAIGVATAGGPASMDKVDYTAAVESMGSSIGGAANYDYSTLSMSSIAPYFDETWALFVETLRAPAWRETDLELRRELMLTSLRTEHDEPDAAVGAMAKDIAFAGHAYEVRPQGWEDTVAAFGVEDLRAAWDAMWVKSRLTVVVVGNLERERVEVLVAGAFGQLPDDSEPAFTRPPMETLAFDAGTVSVDARPSLPTNYVLGYFAGPPVTHADYPALQVALEILSDRLFEEVRTRRNLSYAVSSGLSGRRAVTGYLYVTAVDPNTTLQVMLDTVDGMIDPTVPDQDLHDQIEGYLTRYYRGLQSNGAQASLLGDWELRGGGRLNADTHLDRLSAVSAEDVAEALRTYVRDIQFAVVGPGEGLDEALFTER